MKKRGVDLRIGRLLVRGLGPVAEGRLRDAVERELARSLKTLEPTRLADAARGDAAVHGGRVEVKPSSTADSLGADVAGKVAGHLQGNGGRGGSGSTGRGRG